MSIGVRFPDLANKNLRCPVKFKFQKNHNYFILYPKYCNIIIFSCTKSCLLFIQDLNLTECLLFYLATPAWRKKKRGFGQIWMGPYLEIWCNFWAAGRRHFSWEINKYQRTVGNKKKDYNGVQELFGEIKIFWLRW